MIILFIALLVVSKFSSGAQRSTSYQGVTQHVTLAHINDLNIHTYKDADNRGPQFYNYESDSLESDSNIETDSDAEDTSSSSGHSSHKDDYSASASSIESNEKKIALRTYRKCVPCPSDMMKRFDNFGIKWVCGGYQRARRSFKSICMMKYRNCEDGTMFVPLYNHRCRNDSFHGKHWFYVYRV